MNNEELNNQVPVNNDVSQQEPKETKDESIEILEMYDAVETVAPPTVEMPVLNVGNDVNEDGILKPISEKKEEEIKEVVEQPVLTAQSQNTTLEQPVQSTPAEGPVIQQSTTIDNNAFLENKKMEEVKIEYKEPSKFKMLSMGLLFIFILAVVYFLPQITTYLYGETKVEEPVENDEIMNGSLTCSMQDSNDKYDFIYSEELNFTLKELKRVNETITTRGDKTLDSEHLTEIYDNCKSLKSELSALELGTSVSCDMYEGTVTISQSIDYTMFDSKMIEPIFEKYKINIADFEYNQNIDDVKRNLELSGYTCEMTKSE